MNKMTLDKDEQSFYLREFDVNSCDDLFMLNYAVSMFEFIIGQLEDQLDALGDEGHKDKRHKINKVLSIAQTKLKMTTSRYNMIRDLMDKNHTFYESFYEQAKIALSPQLFKAVSDAVNQETGQTS